MVIIVFLIVTIIALVVLLPVTVIFIVTTFILPVAIIATRKIVCRLFRLAFGINCGDGITIGQWLLTRYDRFLF
jgi:hypothetical protein